MALLKSGADDYITKPFEPECLRLCSFFCSLISWAIRFWSIHFLVRRSCSSQFFRIWFFSSLSWSLLASARFFRYSFKSFFRRALFAASAAPIRT